MLRQRRDVPFLCQMHEQLGITADALRTASLYWQEKSPEVLMLCDSITRSLTQFLGPCVHAVWCACNLAALELTYAITFVVRFSMVAVPP